MSGNSARFKIPSHEMTSPDGQVIYPGMASSSLGSQGVWVGEDLINESGFVFDPWWLYFAGELHSLNMIVLGRLGFGKSALVKSYLLRQMAFGRVPWIISPKAGEYDAFAKFVGVKIIKLHPGGPLRINIFDPSMSEQEQFEVLRSITAELLNQEGLTPQEGEMLAQALKASRRKVEGRQVLVKDIVEALLNPDQDTADLLQSNVRHLREAGRNVAYSLRRLLDNGDFSGMFDGETSQEIDLSGPAVIIDISGVNDAAMPVIMTCVAGWLQSVWSRGATDGVKRIIVLEEAWRALKKLSIARWFAQSIKLSRSVGIQCIIVLHRISDLTAMGNLSDEQVQIALGMLRDIEVRVIYRQTEGEDQNVRHELHLNNREAATIPQLETGVAFWLVGKRSFLVRHVLTENELPIIDTDANMAV